MTLSPLRAGLLAVVCAFAAAAFAPTPALADPPWKHGKHRWVKDSDRWEDWDDRPGKRRGPPHVVYEKTRVIVVEPRPRTVYVPRRAYPSDTATIDIHVPLNLSP